MKSGIYKIINKVNGKSYIGSSYDISRRHIMHRYYLNKNKHQNIHLQRAWNKYGKDNFEFVVVEEVALNKLLIVEQMYLNIIRSDKDKYYNILLDVNYSTNGRKHSEETKQRMRESWTNKERRRRGSEVMKGSNNPNFGKHFTEEHRRKISETMKRIKNKSGTAISTV